MKLIYTKDDKSLTVPIMELYSPMVAIDDSIVENNANYINDVISSEPVNNITINDDNSTTDGKVLFNFNGKESSGLLSLLLLGNKLIVAPAFDRLDLDVYGGYNLGIEVTSYLDDHRESKTSANRSFSIQTDIPLPISNKIKDNPSITSANILGLNLTMDPHKHSTLNRVKDDDISYRSVRNYDFLKIKTNDIFEDGSTFNISVITYLGKEAFYLQKKSNIKPDYLYLFIG